LIVFGEILFEYSWDILEKSSKKSSSYYFIEVHVKIFAKKSFSKKLKSIYKSFYCLKTNVTMFDE
jgi:hypothetical protein